MKIGVLAWPDPGKFITDNGRRGRDNNYERR